jgi:hypothetical protein
MASSSVAAAAADLIIDRRLTGVDLLVRSSRQWWNLPYKAQVLVAAEVRLDGCCGAMGDVVFEMSYP